MSDEPKTVIVRGRPSFSLDGHEISTQPVRPLGMMRRDITLTGTLDMPEGEDMLYLYMLVEPKRGTA